MRGIIIVIGEPARLSEEVVRALELGIKEEPQILPIKQLIIPYIKWEETPKQTKKKGYERPYKYHK